MTINLSNVSVSKNSNLSSPPDVYLMVNHRDYLYMFPKTLKILKDMENLSYMIQYNVYDLE